MNANYCISALLHIALPKGLSKHIVLISILSQKNSKSEKRRSTEVEQTWEVFDTKVIKNALFFKSLLL